MFTCKIPQKNREDYIKRAARTNTMLMTALAIFAVFAELFNIIRVLCFSNSGLATLNNRIYFSFYLFCLACSVLYLICRKLYLKSNIHAYRVSLIGASVWLLWNTLLNTYDVYTTDELHTIVVVTMLTAFSALIIMEPIYAFVNIWLNYFIFIYVINISFGQALNFTLTAMLCTLIYCVRFYHLCIEIKSGREIEEINQKLKGGKFWLTKEQYELISHNAGIITFRLDCKKGQIVFSRNMEEILAKPLEIWDFNSYIKNSNSIVEEDKKKIRDCLNDLYNGLNYQSLEIMIPDKKNTPRWFKVQVVLQESLDTDEMFVVGFMNDITEEKKRIFSLEKNVALDPFTGILNKASINNYGWNLLKHIPEPYRKIALVIFDMDDFKNINDTFGHPGGDYVLKKVANILKENAPEETVVGRLGGDEFIALIKVGDDESKVYSFAKKVINEITKIQWEKQDVKARCSAGYVIYKCDGSKSYEALYKCADEALYAAKNKGKNCVCEYEWENV